jgi:hypothetical protein
LGDQWDQGLGKDPATDRCDVDRDAGYTKADGVMPGQQPEKAAGGAGRKNKRHFCLHFSRGMCAKGNECIFFHRIPTPKDDASTDELVDCFGRQRHAKHRDDMNGTGSFANPCRTLYVAGLQKEKYPHGGLEEAIKRHFIEWGEIEEAKIIHRLSIGFVRYRLRTSAGMSKSRYHIIVIMHLITLDCLIFRVCQGSDGEPSSRSQGKYSSFLISR